MTVSEQIGDANAWPTAGRRVDLRTTLSTLPCSARSAPVWPPTAALLVARRSIAPSSMPSGPCARPLRLGSAAAIVALGQMLVIMMGGIDLSMGASISILANSLVGVSKGSDDKLPQAVVTVFVVAAVIGLVNGLLVAVLDLNPLIVTLAT